MFDRLRRRLTAVCTLITGIILIGMALTSLHFAQRQIERQSQAAFLSDVNSILYHLRSQTTIDYTWLAQTETGSHLIVYLEDNGATPLLYPGSWQAEDRDALLDQARETAQKAYGFDPKEPPETRLQADQVQFTFTSHSGQAYYAALAAVPLNRGWVALSVLHSMEEQEAQMAAQRWLFGGLTAAALLLLWLFARRFTAWALKPLEESRRKQMEFVSAASHELRSPLAVVQTSLCAIPDAPPEEARRFASTALAECNRMSRLIRDLLTLASADNQSWSVQKADTDLETLVLNAYEGFEPAARQREIRFSIALPADPLPRCRCDEQRVAQVLSILIDNALSYTAAGGHVRLSAAPSRGGVQIAVSDNGPGVPDEQKARVFERFYRADPSRSKKEHYGLGLSVAAEIARLHHGRITVTDTPGGGATFTLSLPLE